MTLIEIQEILQRLIVVTGDDDTRLEVFNRNLQTVFECRWRYGGLSHGCSYVAHSSEMSLDHIIKQLTAMITKGKVIP